MFIDALPVVLALGFWHPEEEESKTAKEMVISVVEITVCAQQNLQHSLLLQNTNCKLKFSIDCKIRWDYYFLWA